VIYRLLPAEEFERLRVFCDRNKVPMPSPETSYVAVQEKDGEIVYVHMAQLQLHLDNQCRDKDYNGFVGFREVYKAIEERIPRPAVIYTYPSFENGVRMAEICGFHKSKFPLMVKELPCR
jgi:hypothetical protein